MTALQLANQKFLNKHAAKLLKKLGLVPDVEQLHVSQLMLHFLESGQHGLANRGQALDLKEFLQRIHARNPVLLMKLLHLQGPESSVKKSQLLAQIDPQLVAQILLQALHRETAAQIETYP